MLRLYTLLLFLCFSFSSQGQEYLAHPDYKVGKKFLNLSDAFERKNLDSFNYYRQQAIPHLKKAKAWNDYVDCYNGFSKYYYLKEEFENFQTAVLEALQQAEEHLAPTEEAYGFALGNCGVASTQRGDIRKGQEYYLRALEIAKTNPEDKITIAMSNNNIGKNFRRMGDYEEAIIHLKKALQIRQEETPVNLLSAASLCLSIGHNFRDANRPKEALNYYHAFLNLFQKDTTKKAKRNWNDLSYCYQSMTRIFMKEGLRDSTIFFMNQMMSLEKEQGTSRGYQSYEILGTWHRQNKDYSKALNAYQISYELANKKYKAFQKHIVKSNPFLEIGITYREDHQYDKALAAFQQGMILLAFNFNDTLPINHPTISQFISLPEALNLSSEKARTFFLKYQKQKNKEDLDSAFEHYQLASSIIQEMRQSFLGESSKQILASNAIEVYEGAIQTVLALHEFTQEDHFLEQAFSFTEQNKAILLLESLQESDALTGGNLAPEDIEHERKLQLDIAFYQEKIDRLKQKNKDSEKRKEWEDKLFELRKEHQALIADFEKEYPAYYQLKYDQRTTSIVEIRKKIIDAKTALVEYFIGPRKSYVFCITQKNISVLPIERHSNFPQQVSGLRQTLAAPPNNATFNAACKNFAANSWAISQQILGQVIHQLSNDIKKLVIIPDDILALVPFEILLTEKPDPSPTDFSAKSFSYLLDRYSISYNYSATLLLNNFSSSSSQRLKPFMGWAPTFGPDQSEAQRTCNEDNIYTLDCNQDEVASIHNLFGGDQLLGTAADRNSFIEQADQYRIIHLATHACTNPENFSENKIFFTDDYLSYRDLQNLKLNADLAVLSACNTGSGELIKGEGIMSLSRGFILAGCPSTLMSLWSVDDCTTSQLMLNYYEALKAGLPKDEALREAKQKHRLGADKVFAHPFYWAAFIQSGNAETMSFSRFSTPLLWLGLGLLLGLILAFCIKNSLAKKRSAG